MSNGYKSNSKTLRAELSLNAKERGQWGAIEGFGVGVSEDERTVPGSVPLLRTFFLLRDLTISTLPIHGSRSECQPWNRKSPPSATCPPIASSPP